MLVNFGSVTTDTCVPETLMLVPAVGDLSGEVIVILPLASEFTLVMPAPWILRVDLLVLSSKSFR
jgi:hypothetical protein